MRSGHCPTAMPVIHCDGRLSSDGSRRRFRLANVAQSPASPRESAGFGNAGFGSIRCVIPAILPGTSIMSISIRSNTGLSRGRSIGPIRRSGGPSRGGIIRRIGLGRMMVLADLERLRVSRNDHMGSRGDGGVRKGTPPYASSGGCNGSTQKWLNRAGSLLIGLFASTLVLGASGALLFAVALGRDRHCVLNPISEALSAGGTWRATTSVEDCQSPFDAGEYVIVLSRHDDGDPGERIFEAAAYSSKLSPQIHWDGDARLVISAPSRMIVDRMKSPNTGVAIIFKRTSESD